MRTIYEIYFVKGKDDVEYFLKVGEFLRALKEKKINHFILSFETKKIESLINFSPSLHMDLSVWNRLKKISFPPFYKILPFSDFTVTLLIKCYERGRRICERIGNGVPILFLNTLFDLDEIKKELIDLGINKVVIFEEGYPVFSKIPAGNNFIMVYNLKGKELSQSPYEMVLREKVLERKEKEDIIYVNASPEEFFYLTERHFENSNPFVYKEKKRKKDFSLLLKKIETLFIKMEYLISYKSFSSSKNYAFLTDYLFEEFINLMDGRISIQVYKKILRRIQQLLGFEEKKSAKLFNPFPFRFHYPDRKMYVMREIKPFDFINYEEILRFTKCFKIRKIAKNEFVFIHKEKGDIEPLKLRFEIRKDGRALKEFSKEISVEKGKYYKITFENFKFSAKEEMRLKTIFSNFYPYVIFEGSIKGGSLELWYYLPFSNKGLKYLSHRLKIHIDEKKEDFAYLLYPSKNLNFAIFSPFPFYFKKLTNTILIKIKEGPFLLVFYPFPENEKEIYHNFFPYIFSPLKISEKVSQKNIFFEIRDGIFILHSLKPIDSTKFILRGIGVTEGLRIYFPAPPGEVKLMDFDGEKEIGNLSLKNNEVKIENEAGEIITLFIDFKTSAREIF